MSRYAGKNYVGVAKPTSFDKGCWVLVKDMSVKENPRVGKHCGLRNVPGMLTCRLHSIYEDRAKMEKMRCDRVSHQSGSNG